MSEATSSGSGPVISGVPLAQYAAVTAALGEAFPLKAVLAIEGLDPRSWAKADRGWTERLAEDPTLLARYEAELAAAQDRLARTVEPLDADLGAWLAFLAALARTPELPEQHGIGPDDVARLQRRWDARMREDPALERRAAELRNRGAGKLPPLRVVKGKLSRSPAGLAPAPAAASPAPAAPAPPAPVMMAEPPSPAAWPPPVPHPGHGELGDPRLPPQDADDSGTRAIRVAPKGSSASLPFRDAPSREFLEALVDRPAAAPGEGSDGHTVAVRVNPRHRAIEIGGAPAPLPFRDRAAAEDEPPPSSEPSPGRTVKMRAPQHLAGLAPKDPKRASRSSGDPGATVTGMHSPFARKALPFDAPASPKPPRAPAPDPSAPPPPLSLEHHAYLCLEIALDPPRAAEALARYHVSAADKAVADEYYRARLDFDPELRAQWNRFFEEYRAWRASRPRP